MRKRQEINNVVSLESILVGQRPAASGQLLVFVGVSRQQLIVCRAARVDAAAS